MAKTLVAAARGLRVYGARPRSLVLGYANVVPAAMDGAIAGLAAALAETRTPVSRGSAHHR